MLPLGYLEENRIFDANGNPYAVYVVDSQPYAFQPTLKKINAINKTIRGISSHFGELWVYLLTKQLSTQQMAKEMKKYGNSQGWNRHIDLVKNELGIRKPFTRLNLIVVPLNPKKISIELSGDTWKEWTKEVTKSIMYGFKDAKDKFMKVSLTLPEMILDSLKRQSDELLSTFRSYGSVRAATPDEVEWYLKKSYYRGVFDPPLQIPQPFPAQVVMKNGDTAIRPIRTSLLSLSQPEIREGINHLEVKTETGEIGYQTFLVSTNVPNNIPEQDPTGFEWIYGVVETLSFPVDVALHIRVDSHTKAKEKVKDKKKTSEAQMNEWDDDAQDIPEEIEEEYQTLYDLERKIRQNRQPLLHVKTIFALGAASKKELKERITDFKDRAESFHVLVGSPGDMKKLFQAFYPFGEELTASWEIPMDPGVFGAGMPFGTRILGDPSGFLLGYLYGTQRPVFMDPKRQAQVLNTASAIMITGKLGSGKTYLIKLITYILMQWGAVGYVIDPKGDYDRFAQIPDFQGEVKLVPFAYGAETAITPFRLGDTAEDSYDSAFAIWELILNPRNEEERNIVLGASLEEVYKSNVWDAFTFLDVLKEMMNGNRDEIYKKEAKLMYLSLQNLQRHGLGKMLFGRDTGEALFNKRMLVVIIRALTLPGRGTKKSEWNEAERTSAALLYGVATLGLKNLIRFPKSQIKFLVLEEVWVLREFEQGRKLYNEALRLSRSENLIPLMAGQNATDFEPKEDEEDITGLFGWFFMLRQESITQVESALKILGMTSDSAKEWHTDFATKFKNGLGLARDPEGRIGEIQVNLLDKELEWYFKSTPGEEEGIS